jgi:cytochrome c
MDTTINYCKGGSMRKPVALSVILAVGLFFSVSTPAGAVATDERATPAEVVQKVNEAVTLIQQQGEAAFDTFRDKNGIFVWKDAYLFVMDVEGKMLVHPFTPKLEGMAFIGAQDPNGKAFIAEQIAIVNGPSGQGWMEYWWTKPGEKVASQKASFVKKVPGTRFYVGAGLFNLSKEAAEKGSK